MAITVDISPVSTDAPQKNETVQDEDSDIRSPETLKRKASPERSTETGDSSPKRPRRDSATQPSDATIDEQRKRPSAQDEKKRNKRLFGGLLNTLSQTPASNPAQKRRFEIERRQQERLQKQKEEDERVRKERGDKRRAEWSRNGIVWEEEVMRNRHRRMLATARFLKTKARPAVYFLPSKRSVKQDEMIEEQIQRAKRLVEREEDEFGDRRRKHEELHGQPRAQNPHPSRRSDIDESKQDAQLAPQEKPSLPETEESGKENATSEEKRKTSLPKTAAKEAHGDHDESGDEVVDAEEDMVIY